jgi:hypothetical protein
MCNNAMLRTRVRLTMRQLQHRRRRTCGKRNRLWCCCPEPSIGLHHFRKEYSPTRSPHSTHELLIFSVSRGMIQLPVDSTSMICCAARGPIEKASQSPSYVN